VIGGAGEDHVISAEIKLVAARRCIGKNLHGHGPLQFCIALAAYGEEVVRAEIHHDELVALDKAASRAYSTVGTVGEFGGVCMENERK
jgi:hypothetical protein